MGTYSELSFETIVKLFIVFALLLSCAPHSGAAQSANELIIPQLEQRVEKGDLTAMHEIAGLPAEQALPILVNYARRRTYGSDDQAAPAAAAIEELPRILGHAKYCASLISEDPLPLIEAYPRNLTDELFDVLGSLRTVETVEVLCGYLRDEHIDPNPDLIPNSPEFFESLGKDPTLPKRSALALNAELAAWALNRLHLADAPPTMGKTLPFDLMPIWARWWKDRRERGIPFEVLLNGPVPAPGTAYAPDPRFSRPGTGQPLPGRVFQSSGADRTSDVEPETGNTTAVWLMLLMVLLSGVWLTNPRIRSLLTDEEPE